MRTPDRLVTSASGGRISRRVLLAGGITVAAGAWLFGPAALGGTNTLTRLAAAASARISVGYVEGAATLAEAAGRRALPAVGLPSGQASLEGGLVRVGIDGLTPGAAGDDGDPVRRVHLDALLLPEGARSEPATFHAWSFGRDATVSASGKVVFAWSVGREPTIAFELDVSRGPAAAGTVRRPGTPGHHEPAPEASRSVAVLTSRDEPSAARLREGLYLLGLSPGLWDSPIVVPAPGAGWRDRPSLVLTVQRFAA